MTFRSSVQKRAGKVHGDWHKAAMELGAKLGTPAGATGPVAEISTCNSGRVPSLAVGAFRDVSTHVCNPALFEIAKNKSKGISTQRIRRSLGLAVRREWAKWLIGRCRDPDEDPRQPRTHARETDEGLLKSRQLQANGFAWVLKSRPRVR